MCFLFCFSLSRSGVGEEISCLPCTRLASRMANYFWTLSGSRCWSCICLWPMGSSLGQTEVHRPYISQQLHTIMYPSTQRMGKFKKIILPKAGKDPTKPESYRPIALTSYTCKLFERMIKRRLSCFLKMNYLLLRRKKSTQPYPKRLSVP